MNRLLILIALLALFPSISRAGMIEDAAAATSHTRATFVQRFTPRGFHNEQVERGSVVFGRLPAMRWTYDDPEPKVFVFDGSTSWLYTEEDRQVLVHQLNEAERRDLPFVLLGDSATIARDYSMTESRTKTGVTIRLAPRDDSATIRLLVLTIDSVRHWMTRLEYEDREGNHTVFEFGDRREITTTPDMFRFEIPDGSDVVEQ